MLTASPLRRGSLRIPPGPQKGLPSSAVVIGDIYDNEMADHIILTMIYALSFLDHMFLAMISPLSFFDHMFLAIIFPLSL